MWQQIRHWYSAEDIYPAFPALFRGRWVIEGWPLWDERQLLILLESVEHKREDVTHGTLQCLLKAGVWNSGLGLDVLRGLESTLDRIEMGVKVLRNCYGGWDGGIKCLKVTFEANREFSDLVISYRLREWIGGRGGLYICCEEKGGWIEDYSMYFVMHRHAIL